MVMRAAGRPGRQALPGDWDGMVVYCAGTSWDGVTGTGKQMASRLAAYAPVLYVDPPMSVLTPVRKPYLRDSLSSPRLRLIRPGLARLTPIALPGVSRPVLRDIATATTRRAVARAVRALDGSVHAVVGATFKGLYGACGEDVRVLYGTDDFAAGGSLMHLSDRWLAARERARLGEADRIIAISPTLADRWRALGHEVSLITNGCDHTLYADVDTAPLPDDVQLPGPIAIFVGHLSERIDLGTLEAVADAGVSVLLVGPRQPSFQLARVDALFARPNVQWVGRKPIESLPSYLRLARVGITPYVDTQFNRGSFPLKTLEYLAAGRAAVVSDLPSARWLKTDLISIAATPQGFADATVAALADAPSPHLVRRRQEFARGHSWDDRARQFAEVIGLHV